MCHSQVAYSFYTEKIKLLKTVHNVCRLFNSEYGFNFALPIIFSLKKKKSVKAITYAILQNNLLFHMAPLFPNNTVPQMYNYFVWLYQINNRTSSWLSQNAPFPDSWFGNPSFKYLWSQRFMTRQSEAVESCHTQWSVHLY